MPLKLIPLFFWILTSYPELVDGLTTEFLFYIIERDTNGDTMKTSPFVCHLPEDRPHCSFPFPGSSPSKNSGQTND